MSIFFPREENIFKKVEPVKISLNTKEGFFPKKEKFLPSFGGGGGSHLSSGEVESIIGDFSTGTVAIYATKCKPVLVSILDKLEILNGAINQIEQAKTSYNSSITKYKTALVDIGIKKIELATYFEKIMFELDKKEAEIIQQKY
jgi:hypothetical protein